MLSCPVLTLTLFTPSEAETITGVSTEKQRDWRRHGYLPSVDGHARFDVFALAKMTVMGMLAEHGIGPKRSSEDSDWSAQFIANFVLQSEESWEGDTKNCFATNGPNAPKVNLLSALWRKLKLARIVPNRYSVWLPSTADARFIHSIDDVTQRYGDLSPIPVGPFIAVEHRQIADLIASKATRAFCHVEWSDEQ